MTRGARRVIAGALIALSCVGIVASTVALWAHRTTFDNRTWVERVGPVIDDPAVQAALADHLTASVVELVGVQGRLEGVLPSQLRGVAGHATDALQHYAEQGAASLVATDTFRSVWLEANRIVNEKVIGAIRNGTGVVVIGDDGQVAINLLPFIPAVLEEVRDVAPSFLQPLVPQIEVPAGGSPDEQRAAIRDEVTFELPEGFGLVELHTSPELGRIQSVLRALDNAVVLLPVLTVVVVLAGLVIAPDRREMLVVLGLGTAVGIVAAVLAYGAAIDSVLDAIPGEGDRAAVSAVLRITTTTLRHDALVVGAAAVLLALGAWLAGRLWKPPGNAGTSSGEPGKPHREPGPSAPVRPG